MDNCFLFALMMVYCPNVLLSLRLPHYSCQYGPVYVESRHLACTEVDIPTNFDVELIPAEAVELSLRCNIEFECASSNVLRAECQPIPPRVNLTRIRLEGFRLGNDSRPPYDKFLTNVKGQLTSLSVTSSEIGQLDADFLRGFSSLESLDLLGSDISVLLPDAFQSLVGPEGFTRLTDVDLSDSLLEHVDLSVFQPIAGSLERIDLHWQRRRGLKSISRSGPRFRLALQKFTIQRNSLTRIPKEVLDTLGARTKNGIPSYFDFTHNELCWLDNCTCCEMKEFFQWTAVPSSVLFPCGRRIWTTGGFGDGPSFGGMPNAIYINRSWFTSCD